VDKEEKSTEEGNGVFYVAFFLSFLFAWEVKRELVASFTNLQELPHLMDSGLFIVIYVPFHILFSKLVKWLYLYINNFNS